MNTNDITQAASGIHTTNGTPHGFTALTPFIAVTGAADALDFYSNVFDADVTDRTDMPGPDGSPVVVHATLNFGNGRLQVGETTPPLSTCSDHRTAMTIATRSDCMCTTSTRWPNGL